MLNNEQIKWLAELVAVLERIPDGIRIASNVNIFASKGHPGHADNDEIIYTIQAKGKT